ncbi:MAG: nuclear transport factor 2 family protein [Betaproteobacteria bacterium]|nr:nuclear transport factor 2 family protein [Betaproteobacteria bacterium]
MPRRDRLPRQSPPNHQSKCTLSHRAAEVEALIAAFISNYEGGRLDAFASLFDTDVRTNEFRGRAAVRSEYGELFQRSSWRRMNFGNCGGDRWASGPRRMARSP